MSEVTTAIFKIVFRESFLSINLSNYEVFLKLTKHFVWAFPKQKYLGWQGGRGKQRWDKITLKIPSFWPNAGQKCQTLKNIGRTRNETTQRNLVLMPQRPHRVHDSHGQYDVVSYLLFLDFKLLGSPSTGELPPPMAAHPSSRGGSRVWHGCPGYSCCLSQSYKGGCVVGKGFLQKRAALPSARKAQSTGSYSRLCLNFPSVYIFPGKKTTTKASNNCHVIAMFWK